MTDRTSDTGPAARDREALERQCDAECNSGCHADDCEHHGHLPQRATPVAGMTAIAHWWTTSHTQEAGHDHHCWGKAECICGWRDAKNALDALRAAAPSDGAGGLDVERTHSEEPS